MDTSRLKKFAQFARRNLMEQVQSKLKLVLADESAARREHPKAVKDLEQKLNQYSNKKEAEEQLIEQVAYTWFNRFCALRFMDVNQYNRIMVLSPISGQFQPEMLAEAKAGHLDETVFNDKAREKIQGLLSGSVPSRDGQSEAYRLMIVAVCNDYHRLMPFLFQRIEDYTELLMPDDLLSGNSILAYTREAMTPENCKSVESIGWLYQFYISEKKDLVFEDLKKNKKITPENIPAATQLFTPHWIVKYLVENSLGRLWMLNNPNSKVIEQMEYYIKPVEEEADFLIISSPEELKICDPACGSGHMLTYAYDLLYAIYLDANYDPIDIPELIITKNLYGIEIDERASELAAFALSMKALKGNPNDDGNNRRRFFRNPIKPNVCRLENVKIEENELEEYMDFIGRDLFTQDLRNTLKEFEEADNFGSLIQPTLHNVADVLTVIEEKNSQIDLFLADTHKSVLKVLKQVKYLSSQYHAVIANPPYLGGNGMNPRLATWAKENYIDSRFDTYSMFIERSLALIDKMGYAALVTMETWMSLSRFENFRNNVFSGSHIKTLVHMPYIGKGGTSMGINFGTSATIFQNVPNHNFKANCYCIRYFENDANGVPIEFPTINEKTGYSSLSEYKLIPGSPVAYWLSKDTRNAFLNKKVGDVSYTRLGMATADNNKFLRFWYELSFNKISFTSTDRASAIETLCKWFPYQKGGDFRRWYGNDEYVVNWENDGEDIRNFTNEKTGKIRSHNYNLDFIFQKGITWSALTSSKTSFRLLENSLFDNAGSSLFLKNEQDYYCLFGFLNSDVFNEMIEIISPSLNYQPGDIAKLPFVIPEEKVKIEKNVISLIETSKKYWNEQEIAFGFKINSLVKNRCEFKLGNIWSNYYLQVIKDIDQIVNIENFNDQSFRKSLGLYKEGDYVNKEDIAINSNPYYRYKNIKNSYDREELLLTDSIIDLISYAVGCIFGRYSLDTEGLILGVQSDTLKNHFDKVKSPTFMPDDDNVIPIIDFDGDWFEDDITERFKSFLKVTFGEEHFAENLVFIEDAIGKDIKKYFAKDFYADHVKRYKKRPIYWMFSSPKGSFNALIYMHRYQPDTASIVLNDYLREFSTKLEARKESYEQVEISASASQKDITQAIKAIAKIDKVLEEVNDYEHDVLYPLAGMKIEIDLDDGVKHNYPLFGKALKKIPGLS